MFLLLSFRYVLCFMLGDYVGFCISFGSLFYDFRLGFCLHCRLRHYIFFFVTSSVPVEECSRFSDRRSLLRFPLRNGASIPFALTFYLIFRNLKHVGFHLYICYMKLLRRAFQIAVFRKTMALKVIKAISRKKETTLIVIFNMPACCKKFWS